MPSNLLVVKKKWLDYCSKGIGVSEIGVIIKNLKKKNHHDQETTAVLKEKSNVVALRTSEVTFAITLTEAKERLRLLQEFVKEMMVSGVDYGVVPGCQKPSLLKPGAEKIVMIMGLSSRYEIMDKIENFEEGFIAYNVRCILSRQGLDICEGVGHCNNRESKYIESDPYNIANTILKMSKKRSYVDAAVSVASLSDVVTQDLEDIDFSKAEPTKDSKPMTLVREIRDEKPVIQKPITQKQINKLFVLAKEMKMPGTTARQLLKDRYNADSSDQLTCRQASDFISHLILLQG